MKKNKTHRRNSAAKGKGARKSAPKSVDEYIAGTAEPARSTLKKIRTAIRSSAPTEAIEQLSYGIPAFKYKEMLVWYAAFANHCSLFPTPAVIAELKDELKEFHISKGTIQFPIDKPPAAALVKKIVKARLLHIERKKK